jgi:hypothetical protein
MRRNIPLKHRLATLRYISEDRIQYNHRCANLKSNIFAPKFVLHCFKVHQFNSVIGITPLHFLCEETYCALVMKGGWE